MRRRGLDAFIDFAHLYEKEFGDFSTTGSGISRRSASNLVGWPARCAPDGDAVTNGQVTPGQPDPIAWPYGVVDAAAFMARGWQPTPFRDFVFKVHQRCDLACDYCYVYTLADQSWRSRPKVMSPAIWQTAARRISEHASAHRLANVSVVLHGGEPLLAGADRLAAIADRVRRDLPPGITAKVGIQTNGVLLDEGRLTTLANSQVAVGVSVDGSAASHDAHRRRADGRGSYDDVSRALKLLATEYRGAFGGVLCTIDPTTDAFSCYEALMSFQPPAIDFLLPHANWNSRPEHSGQFGRWLITVFDRWYGAPAQETRIRLFESILSLILGGSSRSEHVGTSPAAVAVIESDGTIEQTDALKSAYAGAAATGLSVLTDAFDAALTHPGVVARQIGTAALCPTCRNCPIATVCGGGHYAHRYARGTGFLNPSVYCQDLIPLISHVRARVMADLQDRRRTAGPVPS